MIFSFLRRTGQRGQAGRKRRFSPGRRRAQTALLSPRGRRAALSTPGSRLYSVEGSAGSGLVGQLMTSTDLKTWTKASAAPNGGKVTLTVEGGEFSTGDIDLSAYAGEEKRFFKIVVE